MFARSFGIIRLLVNGFMILTIVLTPISPLDLLQILKYSEIETLVCKNEENIHVYIPVSETDWKYVQPCQLRSCYK